MSFLKKVYVEDPRDTFQLDDVIRWTMMDKYHYAVIKTEVGWYTTSATENATFVPQKLDFEDLLKIITGELASNVEYASAWQPLEFED